MLRPARCFGVPFSQRPHRRSRQRVPHRKEPAPPQPAARSQDFSLSSVANVDKNAEWQYKPEEVFPRENQDGNSKLSPCGRRCVSTKRSRDSSPLKLVIKLEDSDEECDLVIDMSPQATKEKERICRNFTNETKKKEWSAVICAEKLHNSAVAHSPACTEEKSEKSIVLHKNRSLNRSKKLCTVSQKANEIYLLDVNTDIFKEEIDAHAYSEDKCVSSVASIEVDIEKGILNQENAEEQERNKKESETVLLSSSVEKAEHSGKDTEDSESDDPLEECWRIFKEFEEVQKKGGDKQTHGGNVDLNLLETEVNVSRQKRRIAHMAKSDVHNKNEMVPFKTSPWQQGQAEIEQAHWEFAAEVEGGQAFIATTSEQKKTTYGLSGTQFQSTGQIDSLNLLEVQPIEISSGQQPILLEGNAAAAMPCERSITPFKRIAPVPCKRSLKIPEVRKNYKASTQKRCSIPESRSKVPLETRQRYVTCFLSECFKICSTVNEAFDKAMIEEQSVYDRCGSKKMYLNFAVKTLKKLRDQGQLGNSGSSSGAGSMKSEKEKAFTDGVLYEFLQYYLLTEKQLNENNFPRPNPEKSGSALLPGVVKTAACNAFQRVCCRCGEIYAVTTLGEHKREEECNYHSGRVLELRVPGGMEKHYSCCERIVGSAGCQTAKLHVHDGRSEKLEGFVKTLPKSPPSDGSYGVYALDCEMCYTTHGLELTRVTVVDAQLQVVYDTFVKPDGEVVDYDLRLSGVMEDNLKNTATSLRNVQAILLNLFSADTILIGHNLEKNLLALKMIHETVVDTSVVFPHRLGLPHKRILRSLTAEYLRRIHQDDGNSQLVMLGKNLMAFDTQWSSWMLHLKAFNIIFCPDSLNEQHCVAGHNSREDAIACMELILWKVKEDKGRKRW